MIKKVLAATTDIETPITGSNFFKYTNIGQMVNNVITIALSTSAIIAFLFIIWGGIDLIASQGDKQQFEGARNKITYAIIGLGIVAAAWAIWWLVLKFFGIGILSPTGTVTLPAPK